MRTGHPACGADLTDDLALFNLLAHLDINLTKVGKHADHSLAMVDVNQVAAKEKIAKLNDGTPGRGRYRDTLISGNIGFDFEKAIIGVPRRN